MALHFLATVTDCVHSLHLDNTAVEDSATSSSSYSAAVNYPLLFEY